MLLSETLADGVTEAQHLMSDHPQVDGGRIELGKTVWEDTFSSPMKVGFPAILEVNLLKRVKLQVYLINGHAL